jgi:hypothetical protein
MGQQCCNDGSKGSTEVVFPIEEKDVRSLPPPPKLSARDHKGEKDGGEGPSISRDGDGSRKDEAPQFTPESAELPPIPESSQERLQESEVGPAQSEKAGQAPEPEPAVLSKTKQDEVIEDSTCFIVIFRDKLKKEFEFKFRRGPFGMVYVSQIWPIIITQVAPNSHAAELGIQVGMQVIAVNGQNVEDSDHETVDRMLREASAWLRQNAGKVKHKPAP